MISTNPSPRDPGEQCAHPSCSCIVTAQASVQRDGKYYCSQGCADGRGCEHDTCECVDGERNTG